jgi:hypothetical protein
MRFSGFLTAACFGRSFCYKLSGSKSRSARLFKTIPKAVVFGMYSRRPNGLLSRRHLIAERVFGVDRIHVEVDISVEDNRGFLKPSASKCNSACR